MNEKKNLAQKYRKLHLLHLSFDTWTDRSSNWKKKRHNLIKAMDFSEEYSKIKTIDRWRVKRCDFHFLTFSRNLLKLYKQRLLVIILLIITGKRDFYKKYLDLGKIGQETRLKLKVNKEEKMKKN